MTKVLYFHPAYLSLPPVLLDLTDTAAAALVTSGAGAYPVSMPLDRLQGVVSPTPVPTPTPTPVPNPTPSAAYLGQVANRSYNPTSITGSTSGPVSFKSIHTAAEAITQLQVLDCNWAVLTNSSSPGGTGLEVATKNTLQITRAIEYPVGTVVGAFTYDGAANYTFAASTLTEKLTDVMTGLNIPKGAKFALSGTFNVGTSASGSGAGFPYTRLPDGVLIDTAAGEFINNNGAIQASNLGVFPLAIVAQTTAVTVMLLGDSRVIGQGGNIASNGDTGELAGAIGPRYGYITCATPSDRAAYYTTTRATRRKTLLQYVSHVIYELGINDLNAGGSSAADLAGYDSTNIQYLLAQGKKVYATTLAPITTSTDSWATTANQNKFSGDAARVATNQARRAANWQGVIATFDTASAVESGTDSGFWAVNGSANFLTADGIHENQTGYNRITNSGAITAASFTR